jgi:hypothetical protein
LLFSKTTGGEGRFVRARESGFLFLASARVILLHLVHQSNNKNDDDDDDDDNALSLSLFYALCRFTIG